MPDDRKNIDAKKVASIISNLRKIDPEKADHVYNVYKNLLFKTKSKLAREKFLDFVKAVWPEFISGYHHKEIGEMLGISEEASRWHLHKARQILKEKLLVNKKVKVA